MLPRPWRAYRRARLAFRLFNRGRKRAVKKLRKWREKRRRRRAEKRGEVYEPERAEEAEMQSKPWYQSTAIIGVIVMVAGFALQAVGLQACPDDVTLDAINAAGSELACVPVHSIVSRAMTLANEAIILVGSIMTIRGRVKATKKVTLT